MKLRQRYAFLCIAIIAADAFIIAGFGHIYQSRIETIQFCNLIKAFICFPGLRQNVDVLMEYRNYILYVSLLVFGLSLALYFLAIVEDKKKSIR